MMEDSMTIKEAAAFLKCSVSFIYKGLQREDVKLDIPHWRVGNRYKFSKEDLAAWQKAGGSKKLKFDIRTINKRRAA